MKVYKVYDPSYDDIYDKWEEIMGEMQIREFAVEKVLDNYQDFILDNEGKDIAKDIARLANKIIVEDYKDLTIDEIDKVFDAFGFEYKELYVR